MSEEPGTADPARPQRGAVTARRMRQLTGVQEELLDRIPAERTRYTALAAVMICTASIGGFSMFFALTEVMGMVEVWFVVLAAFWAVFVLCIDCWLVSSTAGSRWRTRVSILLPRIAIAAVFGIAIAEPLVLRVFQTGIVSHIRQERQDTIDQLRATLVYCNPVPGITSPAPPQGSCTGMTLNISSPTAAVAAQLTALQDRYNALQAQVNTETNHLAQLQQTVNEECNGDRGPGLTGLFGNGPACRQDQGYVSNYLASHPIASQEDTLQSTSGQIRSLQGSVANLQASYQAAVAKGVAARLQQETPPSAPIGMAERFQALSYLSLTNGFIALASWFVRIIFILIDCLPVLVKFISGSTPYDRLVDIEIASAERRFGREYDVRNAIADEENATTLWQARAEAARRRKEIDLQTLRHEAARETYKGDAIDELWRQKLDARRSHTTGEGWSAHRADGASGVPLNGHGPTGSHLNGSSRIDDVTDSAAE